jgi:hypothetical protein
MGNLYPKRSGIPQFFHERLNAYGTNRLNYGLLQSQIMQLKHLLLAGLVPVAMAGLSRLNSRENRISHFHSYTAGDTTKKDSIKYSAFKDLPLKPTRKIEFSTNEGSWMSVDVHPKRKYDRV